MINTLENEDGFIYGYIHWETFNELAHCDRNGLYIYIGKVWIHKKYRRTEVLKDLALAVYNSPLSKKAEFVYWEEYRDNGRKTINDTLISNGNLRYKLSKSYKKEKLLHKILKLSDLNTRRSINKKDSQNGKKI